jgi:peptide/nickel transport system substrate-binding protein
MRSRRQTRAVPFLAALAVVAVMGVACAPDDDASSPVQPIVTTPSQPRSGGRLVVGTTAEADGFLPAINRWTPPSFMIARAIFDPLAAIDDTGATKPYLAESFTPNANFTQWTIKLRPNVKFHNGDELTVDALVAHFTAAKDSVVTRDSISYFDKWTTPDKLTMVIDLKAPWAHLPTLMTSQIGFIPAPNSYDPANTEAPSRPVGTGPFRFNSWLLNQRLVVDRNADYWRSDKAGRKLPYLSQIEFRPVQDDTERSARLRSGEFDVVHTEAYSEVSTFQKVARDEPTGRIRALLDNSQGAEANIVLNTQTGAFQDRNLRLAAAYAINRQALVDEMFGGFYELANGPFTARSKWGAASNFPTYFPERARQLVNEWKAAAKGRGAPIIKVTNIAVSDSTPVALKIAKWWTDAGFDVRLRNEEEKVGSVDLVAGRADAVMLHFWDRPDPDPFYAFFASTSIAAANGISLNFSRYSSNVVDQAMKAARGSADDVFRRQQYQKVWDDFAQNLPVLFLYHTRWAIGYQSRIHGIGELALPEGGRAEPVTWGNMYLTGVWVD